MQNSEFDGISSSSTMELFDMPVDVAGLIIERSDYKQQMILRRTSRLLRELVDKQEPALKDLLISWESDYILCSYDDQQVIYTSTCSEDIELRRNRTAIVTDDYEKIAFEDFEFTLKNPKMKLEIFTFGSKNLKFGNKLRRMQNILNSINPQLSVKKFTIDVSSISTALSILPYLKPGVLEKITICEKNDWAMDAETMKEISLLDQWKQAKELRIKCLYGEDFPKEHTTHFKRFDISDCYIEGEVKDFIRDFVLNHENVEFCSIEVFPYVHETNFDSIGLTPVFPIFYHYAIPNSENFMEIMIEEYEITIERKKEQNKQ